MGIKEKVEKVYNSENTEGLYQSILELVEEFAWGLNPYEDDDENYDDFNDAMVEHILDKI